MDGHNYGIIMAGGGGTMFWPLSRRNRPQQFLGFARDGKSFLRETYERLLGVIPQENILVVTLERLRENVLREIPELAEGNLLLEPYARNTAPCIAYAAYSLLKRDPQAVMAVIPADSLVDDEAAYRSTLTEALDYATSHDALITLGIVPDRPDTNFGYIQVVGGRKAWEQTRPVKVKTFTEKPDRELAEVFLRSGEFLWNAGIFMWSLPEIEKAFATYLPDVYELFKRGEGRYNTSAEEDFIKSIYLICKNISVDYGIMEKARNVCVYAADFGWSDLGTWGSLYEVSPKDDQQNVVAGNKVKTYNTTGCIINVPKNKAVVLQGMEDYIVVDNDNVLLICKKNSEQQIRQYVNDVEIDFGEKYI